MGVVWSAQEKETASWLQSTSAFVFPHRQRLRWLPRGQAPHAQRQGGGVPSRPSWGDNQNGGPGFRILALMSHRVRSRVEDEGRSDRGKRSLPLGEAGRSELRCSDLCEPGRDGHGGSGADLVAPPRRQLGQAIGRVSWKWCFSGRMSAAAIPCVSDRYRRRRPKGAS